MDKNIIFDNKSDIFVKSTVDGLYVMPWKLMHDGYEVTRQETVVRVDADAGIPITHSRFSAGGRIIAAKIFVETEPIFWLWYSRATKNSALPCWVKDIKVDGFMKCYITEQPSVSPASTSIEGMYVQIKLYAVPQALQTFAYVKEGALNNQVIENTSNKVYYSYGEEIY